MVPTRDNIKKLSPMMVTKHNVFKMINFLLTNNSWYRASGVTFNPDNLVALYTEQFEGDEGSPCSETFGIPAAIDLCCLPKSPISETHSTTQQDTRVDDGYVEREDAFVSSSDEMLMEAVGYTDGDYTPKNFRSMKANALSWCLDGKKFVKSSSGSKLISDSDPGLLSFLFPALDPWGIGDFGASDRTTDQTISFKRQVKNLLRQHNSPFQRDPSFPYVCWNREKLIGRCLSELPVVSARISLNRCLMLHLPSLG